MWNAQSHQIWQKSRPVAFNLASDTHLFRHQMLTYLTSKGLTDAQIQLISGHESKKSLEVYQHLSLESVDKAYQDAVQRREDLRRFLWDFTYLCWANPSL